MFRGSLGRSIVSSKCPVIVRFKSSRQAQFESVASALAWLKKARDAHRPGADTAHVYRFETSRWTPVPDHPSEPNPATGQTTFRRKKT